MKITRRLKGLLNAVYRFPLTVLCLAVSAGLLCYFIWLGKDPPIHLLKAFLTMIVAAMAGAAAQMVSERFKFNSKKRSYAYMVAIVLATAYNEIIFPVSQINMQLGVRTFVAIFALFCLYLWFPSFKNKVNFSKVILTHLKYIFVAAVFSVVLAAGLSAILGAIDFLLINLNSKIYFYTLVIVWVMFAPLYYLALLPLFNSEKEEDIEYAEQSADCPKFVEILLSYIFIPLLSIFTVVLAAYFIKILVLLKWPVGQLGPMILAYSAVGLAVFILGSNLKNKFYVFYSKVFPIALVPIVIIQLISVGIRVNAYGITESRYYVALFGVFSLVSAVYLYFYKNRNGVIALLVAGFALVSVIPPVDAFTLSRNSQISRLEHYLTDAGILKGGKLSPKSVVDNNTKKEVTNILGYLDRQDYTSYVSWLPKSFTFYDDMKMIIGFEPYYGYDSYVPPVDLGTPEPKYTELRRDPSQPVEVSSYDVVIDQPNQYDYTGEYYVKAKGKVYFLYARLQNDHDFKISLDDFNLRTLVDFNIYDKAKDMVLKTENQNMEQPLEKMTLEEEINGFKFKIVFNTIKISTDTKFINADMTILFSAPK